MPKKILIAALMLLSSCATAVCSQPASSSEGRVIASVSSYADACAVRVGDRLEGVRVSLDAEASPVGGELLWTSPALYADIPVGDRSATPIYLRIPREPGYEIQTKIYAGDYLMDAVAAEAEIKGWQIMANGQNASRYYVTFEVTAFERD